MNNKNAESVLKAVRDKGIKFVQIWFVDILGTLKSFSITPRELPGAFKDGMGFDGSSIEGFARIYESDLLAKPDPTTFQIMPMLSGEHASARMFCDIFTPEGKPYEGDTRFILKRNLAEAAKMGFIMKVGPELEYFYFKTDKGTDIIDEGGYFDSLPQDDAHDMRRQSIAALEAMGIQVEYEHHEVAPSQHEIDLRYDEALFMADKVITYKRIVKQIAAKGDAYASFMPKPMEGVNGSGMHVHQSLFAKGRNAFFDPKDQYNLSKTARAYTAGLLKHCREICAVTNQWVNSYKRLVPGYEAPVYICWGRRNRSALVRVPQYKLGREEATRIECRFPDPACNPYLAFSAMLAAGLEGVKRNYHLDGPMEANLFEMNEIERKAKRIHMLPGSLIESIEAAEKSELLRRTLGQHVFEKFMDNKRMEWDQYRLHVSSYETKRYLPIL